MKLFLEKYAEQIIGVLTGLDRLVIRGTLIALAVKAGMLDFLSRMGVLLKDFGTYVEIQTEILKKAALEEAHRLNRPVIYLPSSKQSKEAIAREIAQTDGISSGLICILTCVEACMTYDIFRNKAEKRLELVPRERKCLHIYRYWIDPIFGFMSARLQTWFPFSIQICINGHEFLARQMDCLGIAYAQKDNCFPWIEDLAKAQEVMDSIFQLSWPSLLDNIAQQLNPAHTQIFHSYTISYYWSVYQSEVSTDVMFESSTELDKIFPRLVSGAICSFSALDVMRFLGKTLNANFKGEIVSNIKEREEGMRLKHHVNDNSVKVYNKQGSVLRVETTINNPCEFKVYRPKAGKPDGPLSWQRMRKGVADLHRRAEISQKSNERYLDALATIDTNETLPEIIKPVCQSVRWKERSIRGLHPWTEKDLQLFRAINRGEFVINGFSSKNILCYLFPEPFSSPEEKCRAGARVTRMLRMLRAHGIIKKIPRSYRYQLTLKGRKIVTAILQCQHVTLQQLNGIPA